MPLIEVVTSSTPLSRLSSPPQPTINITFHHCYNHHHYHCRYMLQPSLISVFGFVIITQNAWTFFLLLLLFSHQTFKLTGKAHRKKKKLPSVWTAARDGGNDCNSWVKGESNCRIDGFLLDSLFEVAYTQNMGIEVVVIIATVVEVMVVVVGWSP